MRFDLFLRTRISTVLSGIAPPEMRIFLPDGSRPRPIPPRISFSTKIPSNVVHFCDIELEYIEKSVIEKKF